MKNDIYFSFRRHNVHWIALFYIKHEFVCFKMKRALVLGASALIILALNQNTVREVSTL